MPETCHDSKSYFTLCLSAVPPFDFVSRVKPTSAAVAIFETGTRYWVATEKTSERDLIIYIYSFFLVTRFFFD